MSERYFNVALGGNMPSAVVEGGSDTSAFACFRVTYDATGNSKRAAFDALEAIKLYLIGDGWPPV
jgi:hypothetical protein